MSTKKVVTKTQAIIVIAIVVVAAVGAYIFSRSLTSPVATTATTQAMTVTPDVLALAKKEGQITFYTSWPETINQKHAEAWKTLYPDIKLNYVALSSSIEASRLVSEFQGGKMTADVAEIDLPYLFVLKSMGAVDAYCAVNTKNINPAFVNDKDCFVQPTVRVSPLSLLYNTKLVSQSDLPSDIWGILNNTNAVPKWAGKFVMADPSRHAVTTELLVRFRQRFNSNQTYLQFLTNIKNLKPRYVTSLIPAAQAIISGEALIGEAAIDYVAGLAPAPLGYLPYKDVSAALSGFVIMKGAPHPNAAKVLAEFLLSRDAAQAMAAAGQIGSIQGILPAGIPGLDKLNIVPSPPLSADETLKWQAYFKQFFEIA